jgi:hypothetical protein
LRLLVKSNKSPISRDPPTYPLYLPPSTPTIYKNKNKKEGEKKRRRPRRSNFIFIILPGGGARRWQEAPPCRLWAFFASREGRDSGVTITAPEKNKPSHSAHAGERARHLKWSH